MKAVVAAYEPSDGTFSSTNVSRSRMNDFEDMVQGKMNAGIQCSKCPGSVSMSMSAHEQKQ